VLLGVFCVTGPKGVNMVIINKVSNFIIHALNTLLHLCCSAVVFVDFEEE